MPARGPTKVTPACVHAWASALLAQKDEMGAVAQLQLLRGAGLDRRERRHQQGLRPECERHHDGDRRGHECDGHRRLSRPNNDLRRHDLVLSLGGRTGSGHFTASYELPALKVFGGALGIRGISHFQSFRGQNR